MLASLLLVAGTLAAAPANTPIGAKVASAIIDHHLPGRHGPGAVWRPTLLLREQRPSNGDRSHPVLYIHGATFPSALSIMFRLEGRSWADALNDAGFDVFALDFAGYGGSERYPTMATDLPGTGEPEGRSDVAALQIERAVRQIQATTGARRVSIIAHSWGTIAAGRFAAAHPDLVNRLVLFGAIGQRNDAPSPVTRPWDLITIDQQHARFVRDVPPTSPPVLVERDFPRWAVTYLASDPRSMGRHPPAVAVPLGPEADISDAESGHFPYSPAGITAPVLLIRGAWDRSSTDADAAWLASQLTHATSVDRVVIPSATHLMHLESGRLALQATATAFLRDSRAADASPADTRSLFAVVFEAQPDPDRQGDYLRIAGQLKPMLDRIPGFVENERFRSRSRPGVLLSLSLWDNEAALVRWRTVEQHHAGQTEGRNGILSNYHLRVGEVTDVVGPYADRVTGWQRRDGTSIGDSKVLTIVNCIKCEKVLMTVSATFSPVAADTFDHLTTRGRTAWLRGWRSLAEANAFAAALRGRLPKGAQLYTIRVLRDYSLDDRREAPQYFPPR